MLASNLGWH